MKSLSWSVFIKENPGLVWKVFDILCLFSLRIVGMQLWGGDGGLYDFDVYLDVDVAPSSVDGETSIVATLATIIRESSISYLFT